MRGGDQTALTRFCFHGIQENAQKEKKSQNARSVRWTQSKISKHTTAHSTKNSAYKSKNDKQMIVLSQLEMSFEDIATVIIVSKTNLY